MGYYSDSGAGYEGQEVLLTLRQLIAGEGGNDTHEAILTYLMGHTFGSNYKDRRAGQMFLLVASPLMRVLGAWDSYLWEVEYGAVINEGTKGTPLPPMGVISILNAVDGVQLSPYMLSIASRGVDPRDHQLLDIVKVKSTPIWLTYMEVARYGDRSLCLQYITRELGYSTQASAAIHNIVMEQLYV